MTVYTPRVYYKVTDPKTAFGTFEELIEYHPEVQCEHPDYHPDESYKAMDADAWHRWMKTGVRESEEVIV